MSHEYLPPSWLDPKDRITAESRSVEVLDRVLRSGQVWISHVKLDGRFALRACITSYRAGSEDVAFLVEEVKAAL